jgi:dTDP-6-deoxy-L-talose 4-dehydrogenase (NAD+)
MATRLLITGATGFVGQHLLEAASHDLSLRLVVRTEHAAALAKRHPTADIIPTADLFAESASWWDRTCSGAETVVHLAWYTDPKTYQNSPRNLDCLKGTCNLAQGAAAAGVKRFVGIGTCAEYEITGEILTVNTSLAPTTPYSAAKAAAYFALSQFFPTAGVSFAWCRLFYLYGKGEHPARLVPYIRARLDTNEIVELSSGEQTRDFLEVQEAARRILSVALSTQHGPINICSGTPTTVKQFAESIADTYGKRHLLRFGARPDNVFDPPFIVGCPN